MVAFLLRMGAGINGTPDRAHTNDTEAQFILPTGAPTFYGAGLVMDSTGKVRVPVTGDAPATGPGAGGMVYGLFIRPYVTNSNQAGLGVDIPPVGGAGVLMEPANVMVRGYMSVLLRGAVAATKGAPVYVWKAAAAGGQVPGGITADGTTLASVMACPGRSYFVGPADANGITQIAFGI